MIVSRRITPLSAGCPVHWPIRPAPGAGLAALRQTFVCRRYGGLGSSRVCYERPAMVAGFMRGSREPAKSEHFGAEFSGAAKAKTPPEIEFLRRAWRSTPRPSSATTSVIAGPWPLHYRRMPSDGPAALHFLQRAFAEGQ